MIKELSVEFLASIHAQYPDAQVLNFENNGKKNRFSHKWMYRDFHHSKFGKVSESFILEFKSQ